MIAEEVVIWGQFANVLSTNVAMATYDCWTNRATQREYQNATVRVEVLS